MRHIRPHVSVVIATRNRPELLKGAVDAVMSQRYDGPIECLVVFDRSDIDPTLVRDDPRRTVRVLANTRTPGLAGARNSGVLEAKGDLVAFCDDDDVWCADKLKRQVETLGDAFTSVTGITVDYGGRRVDRVPTPDTFTLERLVRHRVMEAHPSTVLVRRTALLEHVGLVDEDIPGSYGEDFDFIIRAMQAGPVSVVDQPLVQVRWGQSMFARDWSTIVAAIDYVIAKHAIIRADRRAVARLLGRRAFANAAMRRSGDAFRDVRRTLCASPTEKRAYVTLAVACRLVSAQRLLELAHRRGRGI